LEVPIEHEQLSAKAVTQRKLTVTSSAKDLPSGTDLDRSA
jgi:hypothetical protein